MDPPSPASPLELAVCVGDALEARPLPLRGSVSIGRAVENDVRIDHPSVSRRHAVLHLGPPLRLEDLGGRNGTFVRDPRERAEDGSTLTMIQLSGESIDLEVGDPVTLGSGVVVVRRARIVPDTPEVPDTPGAPGRDPAMAAVLEQAALAARSQISVLVLGETGVGKEVMAHTIHRLSPRAAGPFLALNCAALSESLLESELFGHEKGAFTGALGARAGLFEAAEGGTVFIDEVGDMPPSVQVKLLRVIEERKVLRVGARAARPVDVRFVAATNRDLLAEIGRGTFRQDLYFRLNGFTLTLPPLRRRVSEIAPLAAEFAAQASRQLDRHAPAISPEALGLLERHAWPGNIRELRNTVERAVVLCQGALILPEHLPTHLVAGAARAPAAAPPEHAEPPSTEASVEQLTLALDEVERRRVVRALEACDGNQTRAAELLGISRTTLVARIEQYGLPRPRKKKE